MTVVGHLVEGYCVGYDWYGNYGVCPFKEMRLSPERLENLPVDDYSGFGFQQVEGLVLFIRDIIRINGREFVSLDGYVEERGEVKKEALDLIL
ncbi:MAG: hypothetical protein DRO01_07745 [Thermoproteota archaeon]|nr:MAG: hypothetical protein DRO01_07745 [Candidatus Korarchaeota archaeon]HDH99845.1 hypothetical protein [Bacillota bacterium]